MDVGKAEVSCPSCFASDSPILVVRGTGIGTRGVTLQCRACRHTWPAEDFDGRRAS